jgi:hypothetical protein
MTGPYRHHGPIPHFQTPADDDRPMPNDATNNNIYGERIEDVPEVGDLRYIASTDSIEVFTVGNVWTALSSSLAMIVAPTLADLQSTPAVAGQFGWVAATAQHNEFDGNSWSVMGSKTNLLGIVTKDGADGTLDVNSLPTSSVALRGSFALWSGPQFTATGGPLSGEVLAPGDTLMITPGSGVNGWSVLHGSAALTKQRAVNLFGVAPHDPTRVYELGSVVSKDNALWTAKADLGTKTWDPTDWTLAYRVPVVTVDTTANRPATPTADGDIYVDTDTGGVFRAVTGAWVLEMTIPLTVLPVAPNDGDTIIFDQTANANAGGWIAVDPTTLNPGAATGDGLLWDGAQWVPTTLTLDVLADVDVTGTAPNDGEVLTFDAASNQWKPAATAAVAPVGTLFVGAASFDPVQITTAPGFGMPPTADPAPGTHPPVPGDRYFSTQDQTLTTYEGTAGGPITGQHTTMTGASGGGDVRVSNVAGMTPTGLPGTVVVPTMADPPAINWEFGRVITES